MIDMAGDEKLSWQLHRDGFGWEEIAHQLDCLPAVARAWADRYERRTDAAGAGAQFLLFD
ncbi:hypothetical protein [Rhodococcus marinonascens]|uniref:hypothetical protein n=1 Tax=Rhodococcus marinonascens TaxID=38311 RepID=UPI0009348185|nr:hypothetical protein [Rhodococcus marinonascens]